MPHELAGTSTRPDDLAERSVATVRRWLAESADVAPDASAERLAGVLKDPVGLDFTIGFVDRVVRPEDLWVAGRNLEQIARSVPAFLPWYMKLAIRIGGELAPVMPWPIVPIARRVLRRMVGHLILDATPKALDSSIAALRQQGSRLNINLLGEAVLGDAEADGRLAGTRVLLERDDVDYVSIKVSSVASQLSMWAFDETVERVAERLAPLYELAAASGNKFINLDMEEFRDLDLTIAVFKRIFARGSLLRLEAGIVLQAYLPDALGALQGLTAWAMERREAGGAPIKVRVVKGANLAMEQVDAEIHGWPVATYSTKRDSDTNYKRLLDWAFTYQRTDAVRIGVAGHNLFDIAFASLLAQYRGVQGRVDFEMLLGMATGQADAVRKDVGQLLLYTPVVHPSEFDSAISYLIRRLEENASPENFMSGVFELATSSEVFAREEERFRASLAQLEDVTADPPPSHRMQNRAAAVGTAPDRFGNTPDTDPAIAANRAWGRRILERSATSRLGEEQLAEASVTDAAALESIVASTVAAGASWGERRGSTRAQVLRSAGESLEAARAELIEVMASETGKTISEGDVEVSEAVDFAHYYAERAEELGEIENARFVPSKLIVVTPPWNFPVAIPAGSVLAGLASGAGVIIKPAPQARRSAAIMVQALWDGGVPRAVLTLVDIDEGHSDEGHSDEGDLGRRLVSHSSVDRVILTGGFETAALFRSWRPELPLLAETSGKNAIIVTPSADLDLAASDVVKSAFGHAGQKCSAASIVILVGSVARSARFRRQLVDAARTLKVGWPQDPRTQMGPIIEPAAGKLLRGLTELGDGESWLVEPKRLDSSGRVWSPGVRDGVEADSEFHLTEYFGPVLGIMTAGTLDEAIELQNAPAYGLTAGIHSLDPAEIEQWVDEVEAGNLYVNRGITGAIVRRQPFGGWKRSTVGASAKAGGPNYLLTLGEVEPVFSAPKSSVIMRGVSEPVARLVQAAQPGMEFLEFDRVRAAATSDQRAWESEFGVERDVSGLDVERNIFRYRPAEVTIRLADRAAPAQLVRVLAAATLAGATVEISTALPIPATLMQLLRDDSPLDATEVVIESDAAFHTRLRTLEFLPNRIRLIGGSAVDLARAIGGDPDVAIFAGPVTTSGRIELLPFLKEQAISITAHRFGNPDPQALTLTLQTD